MKRSPAKYIVGINMVLVAIFYVCAVVLIGGEAVLSGFFFSILHVGVNALVAVILTIVYYATHRSRPNLGSAMRGFWLSMGLVALVSFPSCLLVGEMYPFRF